MNVGFYHASAPNSPTVEMALAMVRSVRQAMPNVAVVQFTHVHSVIILDVDSVSAAAVEQPIALAVLEAYASVEGEWLFLDTDVLVQQDVRSVFLRPFDVAVAERAGTLQAHEVGSKFMEQMPYNKGAVFSRSQAFWQEATARLRTMPPAQHAWMGDQRAMCQVIASGKYAVEFLPNRFNYAPHRKNEDLSDKAILHFKGPRKPWMLGRAAVGAHV